MIKKAALALLAMQRHPWEQGVAMQAFFEMGDKDTVYAMAKEAAYRAFPDGRPAMIGAFDGSTDPCSVGEAMLFARDMTGDEALRTACVALEKWALEKAPRNVDGIVYHVADKPQFWVDSMYMLPPYLAAAGHPQEALRQVNGYWEALFNPEKRLMSHTWDDERKQFIRQNFWGVGNGWTVAAFARMIDALPPDMASQRQALIEKSQALIDSLLQYRLPNGLFHDVVDDKSTFEEVNLSQMLAYAIFRGAYSGWAKEEWLPAAKQMQQAARDRVDHFGLVQGVCGAPSFNKPGVAPEGQAFFLMMETAADKYLGK